MFFISFDFNIITFLMFSFYIIFISFYHIAFYVVLFDIEIGQIISFQISLEFDGIVFMLLSRLYRKLGLNSRYRLNGFWLTGTLKKVINQCAC